MSDLTTLRDWALRMAETKKAIPVKIRSGLPHPSIPREAYPTDGERVLWRQIANEIDAFLNDDDHSPSDLSQAELFGEAST